MSRPYKYKYTATFANGHTQTRGSGRLFTYAWRARSENKSGGVFGDSGFARDRVLAEKAARTALRQGAARGYSMKPDLEVVPADRA